jgi:hypothetical protein
MEPVEHTIENPPRPAEKWLRLFYIILFAVINYCIQVISIVIALIQFVFLLIKGHSHEGLRHIGRQLAAYSAHLIGYITFYTDEKPNFD